MPGLEASRGEGMLPPEKKKASLNVRYPVSSLLIYNGSTILHFLLGGTGIILAYGSSWAGYVFGFLYLAFSFSEMYVLMPLTVCPNCVYYRRANSLCVSGLNVISKRIAKEGEAEDFPKRARGLLCSNNLYMAALILPVIALIPALMLNFSYLLLVFFIVIMGLLLVRFFVIFPKIACIHCVAKYRCPQAGAMGVRER